MRKLFFSIVMLLVVNVSFAQFDGEVGTSGCQAISIHNPNIVAWAKGVEVKRGLQGDSQTEYATYGKPYMAQGKPDSTTTRAISLGKKGEAIITFDRPIVNGAGYDFAVFENPFGPSYLELAFVEVSSDGIHYFRFPSTSNAISNADMEASKINNLAGKYEVGWGTPFNLDDIPNDANLNKMNIRFVKVIDVDSRTDTDSQGNGIFDVPSIGISGGHATGFDLTGACILNGGYPYRIADFEGMLSQPDTYEVVNTTNGTLGSDSNYHKNYINNSIAFEALGLYRGTFACGFGPSNLTNQPNSYYQSAAASGLEGVASTYLQAYYSDFSGTAEHNVVRMTDSTTFKPMGVYVCNSGSSYSYALPDNKYFYLVAFGYDENGSLKNDSSFLYLKDKRDGANLNVNEWKWLDLSKLGACSKIVFKLRSDDNSGHGMNVPSYFCIDNFVVDTASNAPVIAMRVTTLAATNIQENSATLNGDVAIGTQTLLSKGFQWRIKTESNWTKAFVTTNNFTHVLNNLSYNTEYAYRAFAVNNTNDTIYGESLEFRTTQQTGICQLNQVNITIYPNPAKEFVDVTIDNATSEANISIIDAQGRVIESKKIVLDNKVRFDISKLNRGIYFIHITNNQKVVVKKLIVN